MAIKFEELRKYVARNVRLSICFEDGYYHDYLMMSDIPEQKYAGFYIYGVGMVDVEFSRDVYMALPEPEGECWCSKDDTLNPAIELMISEEPRDIKRSVEQKLLFRDLKPYLQIGRHFSIVNRNDWSPESLSKKGHGTSQFFGFFLHPGTGLRHKIELSVRLKFRRWLAYVYHVKI